MSSISSGLKASSGGSGSGQKNYLQTSASSSTGWSVAAGTGAVTQATVTASTDTSASIPRPYTTTTALKLVATAASGGTPVSAFAWATFQLDPADYNTKLQLQFAMNTAGGYVASDYQIQVVCSGSQFTAPTISSGTRLPLSTDSSSVSALPNLEGTYRTTFDAPGSSTPYIMVMLIPKTTATSTLYVSDLIVGPGTTVQGAAVTGWTSYTPAVGNQGTGGYTSQAGQYRRVGDCLEVEFTIQKDGSGGTGSNNVFVNLPTGYTINQSAIPSTIATGSVFGTYETGGAHFAITNSLNGTSSVDMNGFTGANFTASLYLRGRFTVPVNELAGSGTLNVAQNDVEFASNSDSSSTATNSASFAYGPSGSAIPNGGTGTQYARVVQFQTPISATDKVSLEFYDGVGWVEAGTRIPFMRLTGGNYGPEVDQTASNQFTVYFASGGANQTETWATYSGSGFKWRLRKSSGGQTVGFGVLSGTSAGLMPSTNTNLDNASATRLGLMQYLHGGSYNGGLAPTVTLSSGGGTLSSVTRALFVPYQMNDGTWRLKMNAAIAVSATSRTSAVFAIAGVTFKNVSGFNQPIPGWGSATAAYVATVNPNTGNVEIDHATATLVDYYFSGDVELDSKPTWAY